MRPSLSTGNTALHDCAESGSLEIMRMLLQFGATMERDGYGMTPLLSASVTGHTNIVDELTTHEQVRISLIDSGKHVCTNVCLGQMLLYLTYIFYRQATWSALTPWNC